MSSTPDHAVFGHPAMNTLFHVRFAGPPSGAAALAGACFAELERLEGLLSQYRPDSDISRLNTLGDGGTLLVDEATHEVLLRAMELHSATGGLFDVTLGAGTPADGQWSIAPDRPAVTRLRAGRQLDLGGIGKGFALDRMARILEEQGSFSALLSAGASTHLALGPQAWTMSLGMLESRPALRAAALSASGDGVQDAHVRASDGRPPATYPHRRIWVMAHDATSADAWSTACLLATAAEIRFLVEANPGLYAVWGEAPDGSVRRLAGTPA